MKRTRSFSPVRSALAALGCAILSAGCGATATFLGDPALRSAVADVAVFESALEDAARAGDHRLEIEWDPAAELDTAWLEERLSSLETTTVILSPYFSLYAEDLSAEHPERTFVAFYGGSSARPNLVRVAFDAEPALLEAGAVTAAWEGQGESRRAAALFLTGSSDRREELAALRQGYRAAAGADLAVTEFPDVPEREDVARAVRERLAQGVNAFLLFLGPANRHALDQVLSEPVVFATPDALASPALGDALLFSIERPLPEGMSAALTALPDRPPDGVVRVNAVVVAGAGYDRPQLAPRPDASR